MKPKKINPRKQPSQDRSRVMTQRIIAATARVLSKAGAQGLTTNKVAKEAKISIGSLYQYFPNKESLIVALAYQMMNEDEALFACLDEHAAQPDLDKTLDFLVSSFLEVHSKDAQLRTEVYSQVFKLGVSKDVMELRRKIISRFCDFILQFHPKLRKQDVEARAFVMFHSCFGVMQAIASENQISEIQLIKKYLISISKALIE